MEKSNLVGKWYELEEYVENSEGTDVTVIMRSVIQYFGNGKFNSDGHLIVERSENKESQSVETFCKIFGSGEWELIEGVLYETLHNSKLTVLEMFIGNIIVSDKSEFIKYEEEFQELIPKGTTTESIIQEYKNEELIYKQLNDEGVEKIKKKRKTILSYEKYVEREL